jgi:hypothetical protein
LPDSKYIIVLYFFLELENLYVGDNPIFSMI